MEMLQTYSRKQQHKPLAMEQIQKILAEQACLKEALVMPECNDEGAKLLRNMFAQQLQSKMLVDKRQSIKQSSLIAVGSSKQPFLFVKHCNERKTKLLDHTRRQRDTFLDDTHAIKDAKTEALDLI